MTILTTYEALKRIALSEFADVVVSAQIITLPTGDPLKLRLDIVDGSLLDVFLSVGGRYSYHWDRRLIGRDNFYRHDNARTTGGVRWPLSPGIFTTAARTMSWPVRSATIRNRLCASFWPLCNANCGLHRDQ